jgi:hypothetical protein
MNGKGNKHIRTDTLQQELLRIALILGVNFLFGTSFVSLQPLIPEKRVRSSLGGGKWEVKLDYTHVVEAIGSDEHSEEYILATFGVAPEDGCTTTDFFSCASFARAVAIDCHALIGAGGVRDPVRSKYNFDIVKTKIADAVGLVTFFKNAQTTKERAINEVLWAKQFNVPPIKDDLEAFDAEMENLVYFQTPNLHYLVMTPTRSSLVAKGILEHDQGLAVKDHSLLEDYARSVGRVIGLPEACEFQNPDHPANIFDFSQRTHAEQACKVIRDTNDESYYAIILLVGDALLEPFWPEGLGVNRGFHSGFDASWSLRSLGRMSLDDMLQERERMYAAQKEIGPNTGVLREGPFSTNPSTRYSLQAFFSKHEEPRHERASSLPNVSDSSARKSLSLEQLRHLRCASRTLDGCSNVIPKGTMAELKENDVEDEDDNFDMDFHQRSMSQPPMPTRLTLSMKQSVPLENIVANDLEDVRRVFKRTVALSLDTLPESASNILTQKKHHADAAILLQSKWMSMKRTRSEDTTKTTPMQMRAANIILSFVQSSAVQNRRRKEKIQQHMQFRAANSILAFLRMLPIRIRYIRVLQFIIRLQGIVRMCRAKWSFGIQLKKRFRWRNWLQPNERVVLEGECTKKKYKTETPKRRTLVLTDFPRLMYFASCEVELNQSKYSDTMKGEISLAQVQAVKKTSERPTEHGAQTSWQLGSFDVVTNGRTFSWTCLRIDLKHNPDSSQWVEMIQLWNQTEKLRGKLIYEGHLTKRGMSHFKTWHRRYFELFQTELGGVLRYSTGSDRSGSAVKGTIKLSSTSDVRSLDNYHGKQHCMELVTEDMRTDSTLICFAESEEVRDEWLSQISFIIKKSKLAS